VIKNKPTNAAIYCRATAKRGYFEPEDADTLSYQVGSAMAFIMDHDLTFVGLYTDEKLPNLHSMGRRNKRYLAFVERQCGRTDRCDHSPRYECDCSR